MYWPGNQTGLRLKRVTQVICETIYPKDPFIYDVHMVKFKFITDEWSISFVVEGKFSERLLKDYLQDMSPEHVDNIIKVVSEAFSEEQIGENEFSAITSVVAIKRILSC